MVEGMLKVDVLSAIRPE
jgi:hypothetical protein